MAPRRCPSSRSPPESFRCSGCSDVFSKPAALKRHFKTLHGGNHLPEGPFSCGQEGCGFTSADRKEYQAHLTSAHDLRLVPCSFRSCAASFLTQEEMQSHRRGHMPFGCPHCHFVSQNSKELSDHLLEHDTPGSETVCADGDLPSASARTDGESASPSTSLPNPRKEEEPPGRGRRRKRAKEAGEDEGEAPPSKDHPAEDDELTCGTHACPKCRRRFKKRSHLQEHLHLHFPDPALQCPTCQRFFTSRSKLRVHRLREAGEKLHRCHLCQYAAVERNAVRRHLVTMHADEAGDDAGDGGGGYPCPTCGQSFRQSRSLKAHMKTHRVVAGSGPVACFQQGCSFRSTVRKELLRHAAEEHGVKAVACRHHACAAIFPSDQDMDVHYRTHLAYHCSHCDFSCSNKAAFLQHRRLGHAGTARLACTFCSFVTFNPVELEWHVGRLHASEKTHRCPHCNYVTAHKRGLKRHMLMHSGEKPHKCSLCEFRCRDESYLSKHMLTHSDCKNFMCADCGYVTKWKHYLNVHMRKHAGDLRYQCDQCPYRCHRLDQLNSHKLRHQAKTLICEVCAYACKRKYELHHHMLAKHSTQGVAASVYRCRYCAYSTRYRQALQNHENCRHTRLREFRCALCLYSAFSSVSLFLHKRKAHGYVPGDKAWLENYAAKERERSSTGLLQGFYGKPLPGSESLGSAEEPPPPDPPAADAPLCHAAKEVAIVWGAASGNSPEYCTLVLTALSSADYEKAEEAEFPDKGGATPAADREEGDAPSAHEEPGGGDSEPSRSNARAAAEPQGEQVEEDQGTGTFVADAPAPEPGLGLSALKKHDKEQAEAMLLEGRVQMLLVPGQEAHRRRKCAYDAGAPPHQRHARARRHVECQACGAAFRQRRGLDTHLAKKCPAGPRENRTFVGSQAAEGGGATQPEPGKDRTGSSTGVAGGCRHGDAAVGASDSPKVGMTSAQTAAPLADDVRETPPRKPRYTKAGGEFKCRGCSFSSATIAAIRRHIATCQGPKWGEGSRKTVDVNRAAEGPQMFSCPDCAFECSRRRALDVHRKLGCSRSPSRRSSCDKSPAGGEPKRLSCRSCAFTCRQERRMTQHVALKHKGVRPHRCPYCPFSTARRYRLEEHRSLHTGVGRHACDDCGKTFGAAAKLRQHKLRVHHGRPTHPCSLCDFGGYAADDLRRHTLRCHTGELRHACGRCAARFSSEAALRSHRRRAHRLAASFTCRHCDFTCGGEAELRSHRQAAHPRLRCAARRETFPSKDGPELHQSGRPAHRCPCCAFAAGSRRLLAQHLLDEHEDASARDGPLRCSSCPFACRHQPVLEQHLRSHGGRRLYRCADCAYSTRNRQKITWHVRTHTGEKPYRCPQCSYACSGPSRLKLHMRVHQDEKKYLCPECGYKCKWATQLKYHMTKHTGEKRHACSECEYRTNRADALRAHRLTQHCDSRPYVCEECGKAFKTAFVLKTHQRQHSDGRPYACGACHKAFRWPAGLRHHFLSHTQQRPFGCRHCGYRAKQRFQVVKHLQRHHPQEAAEEGVVRDSDAGGLTLKEALRGAAEGGGSDEGAKKGNPIGAKDPTDQ